MPCDEIRTSEVDLGKIGDRNLLMRALAGLGFGEAREIQTGMINFGNGYHGGTVFADGRVELRGNATRLDANAIKRAYSVEAVKLASSKFGWKLTQTATGKFVAQKRGF